MKQEDRDLLFRYLSMTLPYELRVELKYSDEHGSHIRDNCCKKGVEILNPLILDLFSKQEIHIKPYLRPMSSMTDEEDKQRIQLGIWRSSQTNGHEVTGIKPDISQSYNSQAFQRALIFLLKNHFDIIGLIPKGLAIAVTKENNPYNIMEG